MSPAPADMGLTVILGAGGHARVLLDALRAAGDPGPLVILDRDQTRWGQTFEGVQVAGGDDLLPSLVQKGATHFLVGLGSVGNNRPRLALFTKALDHGLLPRSVIHPTAIISPTARLGLGVQLLAGCIINPGARLGDNVILNTGALVEHDCLIENHAHIAPRACLAGGVQVGTGANLGAGSLVRQGVKIGAWAQVGMGAVVTREVPHDAVVVGVPARPVEPEG